MPNNTSHKSTKSNFPPSDWVETTLGEVIKTNISSIGKDFEFDEILYLDTGSITENRIEQLQSFSISEAPSRAKRLVKENDIVYSTVRPNQRHFGFIQNPQENLVVSTGFSVISAIPEKADSKFLYYFLTQDQITNNLQQIAEHSTSTYPSIRPEHIENLEISLPPLPEQQAIASVLSAFDDKIELLREQNKILEELGQTIFKEWFGKYRVDDELPDGWRVGKLGEVVDHIKNNIIPSKEPNKLFSHYSIPSFDNGKKSVLELGEIILSNKYQVVNNSFLVSKLNPSTPRIWTVFDSEKNAICSTEFQVFKPKDKKYFAICHCFLNSQIFTDELSQKAHGTSSSHQRVKPQDILDLDFIIPNEKEILSFHEKVLPFLEKIKDNSKQIQSLARSRDELLPRLMWGQQRVIL